MGCDVLLGLDVLFGVVGLTPSPDTKDFTLAPAPVFTSSQLKLCFTGSSDRINPFFLEPLTRRFSVPFSWRADVHGYCSNEWCFEAPGETFRTGSLSISASNYSISAFITALGFVYGVQDKLPAGELKGLQHFTAPQGAQQLGRNENPSFNSYWMAAKAVSPWIAKENKLKQKIPFPTVGTARLSLGRAPPRRFEG